MDAADAITRANAFYAELQQLHNTFGFGRENFCYIPKVKLIFPGMFRCLTAIFQRIAGDTPGCNNSHIPWGQTIPFVNDDGAVYNVSWEVCFSKARYTGGKRERVPMDQSGTFYEYVAADSRVLRISPIFEKLTAASVREACGLNATCMNANNQQVLADWLGCTPSAESLLTALGDYSVNTAALHCRRHLDPKPKQPSAEASEGVDDNTEEEPNHPEVNPSADDECSVAFGGDDASVASGYHRNRSATVIGLIVWRHVYRRRWNKAQQQALVFRQQVEALNAEVTDLKRKRDDLDAELQLYRVRSA